ncbi:MAG: hypothetical protein JWM19_5290 [Actinomycetia bacterium]|nr:hypothetical protein [Actinomycetes bacterium]
MNEALHVWLWTAGRWSGVTGDEQTAKQRAGSRLLRGHAARVQRAVFTLGAGPVGSYIPIGDGWKTIRPSRGPITWEQFPRADQEALAS